MATCSDCDKELSAFEIGICEECEAKYVTLHDIKDHYTDEVLEAFAKQNGVLHKDLPKQIGGSHYAEQMIEPIDYIMANKLGFNEGNVIKYVTRHKSKNGAEDILKAIHYLEFILKYEYGETR